MKKVLTTVVAVFLVLVVLGTVLHPDNNLTETIALLKRDISPIISVFGFASDTVQSIIPKQVVEISNPSYEEYITTLKSDLEMVLPKWFESKGLIEELKDEGPFNLRVFSTNLHTEHKVCCVVMTYKGENLRIFYCAECNLVVGIAEVHVFRMNALEWIYPQTQDKISYPVVFIYYTLGYDTYLKYLR